MTATITITHHQAKPEYKWEVVVPEGPTILLPEENLPAAMHVLGLDDQSGVQKQIEELPNGGSRSINADLGQAAIAALVSLGVKTV